MSNDTPNQVAEGYGAAHGVNVSQSVEPDSTWGTYTTLPSALEARLHTAKLVINHAWLSADESKRVVEFYRQYATNAFNQQYSSWIVELAESHIAKKKEIQNNVKSHLFKHW